MLGKKTDGLLENLRILKLIFVKNSSKYFHEAPHTVTALPNYMGCLMEFFSLFPEQFTLQTRKTFVNKG
jgi:hypothetical protein